MNQTAAALELAEHPTRIASPPNRRLDRMRFLSRLLDTAILLPGGYRIGLDPLIGLVPGFGDFLAGTLSVWLIYDAARLGISKRTLARMAVNVLVDTGVANMHPPEISCENQMLTFELERLRGVIDAGLEIFALKIRKLGQQILKRIARREILQHRLDWTAESANDGFAMANLRINRDARQ